MKIEVKGFVDVSLVDWDGKVTSVIFLPLCNLRCPFCQNATLVLHPENVQTIPFQEIENRLSRIKKWIDGVVITGGEPTLHSDLPELCRNFKDMGLEVKLDTNGTNPKILEKLVEEKLTDYVALDIKAPLIEGKYSKTTGIPIGRSLQNIKESMEILANGETQYEFRTTVVPTLHTAEDIEEICKDIRGCRKYAIQNFRPSGETIDPSFRELKAFSRKELETFGNIAKKYISKVVIRG